MDDYQTGKNPLPAAYSPERLLAAGFQGTVWLARLANQRVVVRILPHGAESVDLRAELAVLAAIDHAGLARLVDHGIVDSTGDIFVARSWIEGVDLSTHAQGLRELGQLDEIGRIIARLCPALDHLHKRGFVHADLKPSNVIITPDGQAVITDFGLARSSGSREGSDGVSGTLFALAPEQLLGGRIDARTDLFALGAMLHLLLLGRRQSARDFYARFPAEAYFEAMQTSVADLPEWARDIAARLLERDPGNRMRSAAEVGRALSGRLGLPVGGPEVAPALRVPFDLGRKEFLEAWRSRLLAEGESAELLSTALRPGAPRPEWWILPEGEDPEGFLTGLRLALALDGCPARLVDLTGAVQGVCDAGALDRWARDLVLGPGGTMLLCALPRSDPWSLRVLECMARSAEQAGHQLGSDIAPRVIAAAAGRPHGSDVDWREADVPRVTEAELLRWLEEQVEGVEIEKIRDFATLVARESAGAATRIELLLERALETGWLLQGDKRLRLRRGPLPLSLGVEATSKAPEVDLNRLGDQARRLLATLFVLDGAASMGAASGIADLPGRELASALERLLSARLVHVTRSEGVLELSLEGGVRRKSAELVDEGEWRTLHARAADRLQASGSSPWEELAHRWRAEPSALAAERLAAVMESLRDRGLSELALSVRDRVARMASPFGLEVDPRIEGEAALAWASLGEPERALGALRTIETRTEPVTRAFVERVRGEVATLRRDHASALAHFVRAAEIDPACRGEALLGRARLLIESHDEHGLDVLEREVIDAGSSALSERTRGNLVNFFAMSRFRRGEVERARTRLEDALAVARKRGDDAHEAAVLVNLATVARRTGDLAAATGHLERAVELCEKEGLLPGQAQARALLGSTLREAGELGRADPLLASALAIRERLGDRPGAAAVRAMRGLVCAERGHLQTAIEELSHSAVALRSSDRAVDAPLLEARADEVSARLGRPEKARVSPEETIRDPRVGIARARARWLRGDAAGALVLARESFDLATRLRLAGALDEAGLLVRCLGDDESDRTGDEPISAPLVREDEEILAHLSAGFDDPVRVKAACDLANALEARGRDDRAARLYLALASRSGDRALAVESLQRADAALARCGTGLDPSEMAALRSSLLAMPDPVPADLVERKDAATNGEDWDMDIVNLLEINHRLVQHEDPKELLGVIVESALTVTGAERGFLVLEDGGELVFDTALDSRRGDIGKPEMEVSKSIVREALSRGTPLRLSNASDDPLLGVAPSVNALVLRSILCAPFPIQPGLRGVIYVDHRLREGAFGERAERLLALLADQAALAIRQTRRVEEIRRLNRELKREVASQESDLRTARAALVDAGLAVPSSGLIGRSAAMRGVHALIERTAPSRLPVLVLGASGTGKELAARALHRLSPRSAGPFVTENCAALPAALIEAELFGYKKGAYTGADQDRAGMFERAERGTLFLDEIGELPLELQAKLLRVLETSEVRRLGASRVQKVDFRLVVATNRDIESEVREGRFRADLYYRLDGLRIALPLLSARVEDIPELVDHFLRLEEAKSGVRKRMAPAVAARLCRRAWPGNVRELANEVARLWVLSAGDIDDVDLVRSPSLEAARSDAGGVRTLEQLEREAIERALERTGGDKRKAAELLGISRAKVYQRLKEWQEERQGALRSGA